MLFFFSSWFWCSIIWAGLSGWSRLGLFLCMWSDAVWWGADWSQRASRGILVFAPCSLSLLSRLGLFMWWWGRILRDRQSSQCFSRLRLRTGISSLLSYFIVQSRSQVQIRLKRLWNRLHFLMEGLWTFLQSSTSRCSYCLHFKQWGNWGSERL